MEVKNVIEVNQSSIYQRNHLVLSDVNFSLAEGEFVYLIGKTGSGKSSLLKVLYGDLPLKNGNGKVVGIDLKTLKQVKFLIYVVIWGLYFKIFNY